MITILGISAFYHDSAAALIADGNIIAAAQEERFTRKKHDDQYPKNAINYVLSEANLKLSNIDHIVFFEKPFLKFERLLETYLAFAPKGFKSFSLSMPIWLREKLFQKNFLFEKLKEHDNKKAELENIMSCTIEEMWLKELEQLKIAYNEFLELESKTDIFDKNDKPKKSKKK